MVPLNVAILQTDINQQIEGRIDDIARAARELDGLGGVGLVVAPEYHFRRAGVKDVKNCHVSKNHKDYIRNELTKISDRRRNVVVIPGTIPWRVPREDRPNLSREIARKGGSYFDSTNNMELDGDDNLELVVNYTHDHYLFNTAYVFHAGRFHAVDKEGDFQESSMYQILVHEKMRPVFDLRVNGHKLRFGVEICLDHCMGTLKNYLSATADVDVHVIVSDYVSNKKPHFCARRGGVIVHAATADRAPSDDGRLRYYYTGSGWQLWDSKTGALKHDLLGNLNSSGVNRSLGAYTVCNVTLD